MSESPSGWGILIYTFSSEATFWQLLGEPVPKSNCRSYERGETKRSEQEGSACSSHQMAEQLRAAGTPSAESKQKAGKSISLSRCKEHLEEGLFFLLFFFFPLILSVPYFFSSPKRRRCPLQYAIEILLIGSMSKTQVYGLMSPYPEYSAAPISGSVKIGVEIQI